MRFAHLAGDAEPLLVAVTGRRAVPLGGTLDDLVAGGPAAVEAARRAVDRSLEDVPFDEDRLIAPLLAPSKIVCIGMNYRAHAVEQQVPIPDRPLVFAKFPSALTGPRDPVAWSTHVTQQVDWEAELAVVIGRRLRDSPPETALAAVFGYCAANDVSARDLQSSDGQWVRSKSLDSFLPLGPVVVTADEIGDPNDLRIGSRVNGETMQDSTTADMVFGVADILSFLSHSFTLEPGDLVLTGTPEGVGAFREPPRFLESGDVVEVEIERIGVLRNRMVERAG